VEALLEREAERTAIEAALDRAAGGEGTVVALEGPAGIGKSALLVATRSTAAGRGMRVLRARCSTLEREFPYGVARQLLEPLLSGDGREGLLAGAAALAEPILAGIDTDAAATTDAAMRGLHGLHWFTANAAREEPLALLVDDAQWADGPSLRWLAYLAARIDGLAVGLVLACRPPDDEPVLDELLHGAGTRLLKPRLLSGEAAASVVEASLGAPPAPEFAAACHHASGGNPFLLAELLRALAHDGVRPDRASVRSIASVTPSSVAREVRARLRALPAPSAAVAHALAVLGGDGDAATVAAHTGLALTNVLDAADALRGASVLADKERTLAFVHPIVGAAAYADLGSRERTEAHQRAAAMLDAAGAPPERRAVHLMACEPAGEAAAAWTLFDASRAAAARGALDIAAHYAERALREPPPRELKAPLLEALGVAELLAADWDSATGHLLAALEHDPEPRVRATVATRLSAVLTTSDAPRLLQLQREALEALGDADDHLRLWVESSMWTVSVAHPAVLPLMGLPPEPPDALLAAAALTPIQRMYLCRWASLVSATGTAADAAVMGRRALADGELLTALGNSTPAYYVAPSGLWMADDLDAVLALYDGMVDEARRTGSESALRVTCHLRAGALLRAGRLGAVEEDAETAGAGWGPWDVLLGRFCLAEARAERGDLDGAERALREAFGAGPDPTGTGFGPVALNVRARVALAARRPQAALEDLERCAALEQGWFVLTPCLSTWRSDAAFALAALGRHEEARERADEAVEQARGFGAARPLGLALRALAAVTADAEPLEEALDVLSGAPALLEHAKALVAFGELLRRGGKRQSARGPLREGLSLALECGATVLANRAREELHVAGGRAPHRRPEQRDELTPSERRVVAQARDGMTNREIAQAFFLTEKTVETHLRNAYRKLGIRRRSELAATLTG
jgi:DNA-binding CsgD family transcriptional regulator